MTVDRTQGARLHWLGPYGVVGSNRAFRLLFGAYTLSTLIDWLYVVALFILSYRLTHAATVVALLTLTRLLPYALVLAGQAFHLGTQGIGFLNAAYAVGGLLGGFLIGPLVSRRSAVVVFMRGAGASSIAEMFFGLSPAGALPFVFWFLTGFADAFAKITAITIIQATSPRGLLGRVFGAFESIIICSMLVGALIVSPAISGVGARASCVAIALLGLVVLAVSIPILVRSERMIDVRVFLLQVPVLNQLSVELLDTVVQRLELDRFGPGRIIIKEGDIGDRMYLIRGGTVEVVQQPVGRDEVSLSTLSRGDYFGETALLRDVPRTATCRAVDTVELYSLGRSDFQSLRDQSEDFDRALLARSDARAIASRNRLLIPV